MIIVILKMAHNSADCETINLTYGAATKIYGVIIFVFISCDRMLVKIQGEGHIISCRQDIRDVKFFSPR